MVIFPKAKRFPHSGKGRDFTTSLSDSILTRVNLNQKENSFVIVLLYRSSDVASGSDMPLLKSSGSCQSLWFFVVPIDRSGTMKFYGSANICRLRQRVCRFDMVRYWAYQQSGR